MAVLGLGLSAACSGDPVTPAAPAGPGTAPVAGPPPPTPAPEPTPPPASSPLIGTWRAVNLAFLPSHIQTTTWRFQADGACLQTFVTIADGVQLVSDRPCTWIADATTITVTRAGATRPVSFVLHYSFPEPDRLRLDDDEFERVA